MNNYSNKSVTTQTYDEIPTFIKRDVSTTTENKKMDTSVFSHFIKLNIGNYETIVNKMIDVREYKKEYVTIFNYLNDKYRDLCYVLDINSSVMIINQETQVEPNWLLQFLTFDNTPQTEMVELCRLSLIPINNQIKLEIEN